MKIPVLNYLPFWAPRYVTINKHVSLPGFTCDAKMFLLNKFTEGDEYAMNMQILKAH